MVHPLFTKNRITAIVFKYVVLSFAFLGSMGLTAQSTLPDSLQTQQTEVAANIYLAVAPGATQGWLEVVIDNRNTGASCIGGELSVYNGLGEKVFDTFVNTPKVNLDLRKLIPGTYTLQFTFEKKVVKKEMVIN